MGCTTNDDLWSHWLNCLQGLRPACARTKTFLWMTLVLIGLCTRGDRAGATSWIRSGYLLGEAYRRLLHVFRSTGISLEELRTRWIRIVLERFCPLEIAGHIVLVADGLKVPKEGRRMPGVKSLHQESENNSKPEFIMGHSYQSIGLMVEATTNPVCVPIVSQLHEGIKRSPSEKGTLLEKLIDAFLPTARLLGMPALLLADAYYASKSVIQPLLAAKHHLVTRVRRNAVAYEPPPPRPEHPGRGRPRIYGAKVVLNALWSSGGFVEAPSPAYGEKRVTIRYLVRDLMWRPVGRPVRFVLVEHPSRGRIILLSTHLGLDPVEIIRLYALRFKIEVSFKQAIHTVGAYSYRFWLKAMKKVRRGSGDQYLHRAPPSYRESVWRKVHAYELHVQLGLIAQGLLLHLAIAHRSTVWSRFGSWMRTMHTHDTPTEAVVAQSLKASLPEFLLDQARECLVTKFMRLHVDWARVPGVVAV